MGSVVQTLREHGGVASIAQLRDAGFSDHLVRALRRSGKIRWVRRGWYATLDADPLVVQAARAGGSLTCVSGCAARGVWQPHGENVHVAVPNGSRHLKDPPTGLAIQRSTANVTLHWNGPVGDDTSFRPGPLDIMTCLEEVLRCQPADLAFAVTDSAMHLGLISREDVAELSRRIPSRSRVLSMVSGECETGSESLFFYRMLPTGVPLCPQVEIPAVGRVDFLIGDRLIVEIDSEEHHGSSDSRRKDLQRDAIAASLDFETLRFDYSSVMFDWAFVASTVDSVVARGDHLRSARSVIRWTRRP